MNRLSLTLIQEWHPNNILKPDNITCGSHHKVWWKCQEGHEWQALVSNRARRGDKCPYCVGKLPTTENNLAVKYPEVCKEWDYNKNKIPPEKFLPKSHVKVWWICPVISSHEWEAAISHRTIGEGCPYCSNNKIGKDNNFAFLQPELLKEWNWNRNTINPYQIAELSSRKIWWKCFKGHEWQDTPVYRVRENYPCGFCSGRKLSSINNFQYKCPNLVRYWNPKNELKPDEVLYNSTERIFWICDKGHEWEAIVYNITNGRRCPYCSNQKVCEDNNLAFRFPKFIKEWHSTLNGNLTPDKIVYGSNKRIWWICEKGHEWDAVLSSRTLKDSGCPICTRIYTGLEKIVEERLLIKKFDKYILNNFNYKPDFQLSENIFLNVDGLYWHSELYREKDYHFKLREDFESEGKRILQFYEDEIYSKWDIIENLINNSLNKTIVKLDARKTKIRLVTAAEANSFNNMNHLMGAAPISRSYGLIFDEALISLIAVKNKQDTLEISRFCTKIGVNMRGGFSKLLSHLIRIFNPKQIISFCDLRYATGKSYEILGFQRVGITRSWQWTDKYKRYNRLACTASNDKTEKENALDKKWYKIYDAGQAKYVLNLE